MIDPGFVLRGSTVATTSAIAASVVSGRLGSWMCPRRRAARLWSSSVVLNRSVSNSATIRRSSPRYWPPRRGSPSISSGWSANHSLTRTGPSIVSKSTVRSQSPALFRSAAGGRRRNTTRSVTACVPATAMWVDEGSRTAVTRSARSLIWARAESLRASSVKRDVSTATSPPGRQRLRDLMMKWLWID